MTFLDDIKNNHLSVMHWPWSNDQFQVLADTKSDTKRVKLGIVELC
jgi:hypothetical protein